MRSHYEAVLRVRGPVSIQWMPAPLRDAVTEVVGEVCRCQATFALRSYAKAIADGVTSPGQWAAQDTLETYHPTVDGRVVEWCSCGSCEIEDVLCGPEWGEW